LLILRGKNEVTDELAKLGSIQDMVPTGVLLQKLHKSTMSKALAKANKAAESSKAMEIYSDWHTPFMIYLRTGGFVGAHKMSISCINVSSKCIK
jgi:hypothetical protein